MRPRHIAIAAALALFAAVPPATAAAARHATSRIVVIRAHSQLVNAQAIDANPTGTSGDRILLTEKVLNAKGRTIGHDFADCVRLFDERSLCTGVYDLRRGQLMVQLLQPALSGRLTYRQAITGGTDRFDGASGAVTVHQGAAGVDRFTFRIRVPRR
jgi:hypothetical protein